MTKKWDIILADPCWPYTGSPDKYAAAGKHYDLMSWEDIWSMPVSSLAHRHSILFMWATCPLLDKQIETMSRWGFHYRGVAFVWVKTRKDGGIISGQGPRPSIVKPTTELLLAGSLTKSGRPMQLLDESMGQVVLAPREQHSKKPDVFMDNIVKLYGDRSRIELFARSKTDGWDASGIELDETDYRTGVLHRWG